MTIFTSEGYYDPGDPATPVKHRLEETYSVLLKPEYTQWGLAKVVPNQVNKIDGTSEMFYTTHIQKDMFSFELELKYPVDIIFELSDFYIVYQQFIDYQPVPDHRNLGTVSGDKEIMKPEYYGFYI